jgi:hypothetical protein
MYTSTPKRITGHVVAVKHHGHTVYGNPTISAVIHLTAIDGVEAVTSTPVTVRISDNASIVYGIENADYRDRPHTFALTRAGRISHEVR